MADEESVKAQEAAPAGAGAIKEPHPLAVFKRLTEALRLHHKAGNGVHTELLAQADAFLKEFPAEPCDYTK